MIDLSTVDHHPALNEVVEVICNKTQNTDKAFFRTEVAYFLGKMASSMHATILTKDRGEIPVNVYAIALAGSGYGKGHSVNIMETEFLGPFKKRFVEYTLPLLADDSLNELANNRAARDNIDFDTALKKVKTSYERKGAYPFTFDSGTAPAVKQLRQKLLMAKAGSINLQIDEIGLNLLANIELLTLYLELYDMGLVKPKLTKNTSESEREEELEGKTPTNMLLFGTPNKLLDGGEVESSFISFLETGYARRCFFGWGQAEKKSFHQMTPEEIYRRRINPQNSTAAAKWAQHFHTLADPTKFGWKMQMSDEVAIALLTYQIDCEAKAEQLSDYEEIRKAELMHRYFKALKLAGAYAFIDESSEVELGHLYSAIKFTEESGESFQNILKREKAYVKLAKYIASAPTEVTHADLHEALSFYKGAANRNEMMTLAVGWGYRNNILIKKTYDNGIEFFKGESLEEIDLEKVTVSYSVDSAFHYKNENIKYENLHVLVSQGGDFEVKHKGGWCNHHFEDGHRIQSATIPGFDLLVFDVDGGTRIKTVMDLLKDYKWFLHTTASHTPDNHRFRLVMPMNYKLYLDQDEYTEFMNNVMNWLPFKVDTQSTVRCKKWTTNSRGKYKYNDGALLDILPFIPKTAKNEEYLESYKQIQNFGSLERWFAARMEPGNRNNMLLRYGLALADSALPLLEVEKAVYQFNSRLSQPLAKDEIASTIMKTIYKRYTSNKNSP